MPNKKFSPSTSGFYIVGIHKNIPIDAINVSLEQEDKIRIAQSSGKTVGVSNGELVFSEIDVSEVLNQVKADLRPMRNALLTSVVQIALVARDIGDNSLANEVLAPSTGVRDRLLNITDDPVLNAAKTREEMEAAVLAYYAAIVVSVSPQLRIAFKDLDK